MATLHHTFPLSTNDNPSEEFTDDCIVTRRPPAKRLFEGTAMLRPPYSSPDFCDGMCLIAVDCATFEVHPSDILANAVAVQLGVLIGRIPPSSPEDYKMGAEISEHLGLGTPPGWLAALLGLHKVDRELKRALEAALCSVLATTVGPADIATILFAIGTFIHAHPLFKEIVKNASWAPPYGGDTAYQMAWLGTAEFHDRPDGKVSSEPGTADRAEDAR